jgi:hypothetical protein
MGEYANDNIDRQLQHVHVGGTSRRDDLRRLANG